MSAPRSGIQSPPNLAPLSPSNHSCLHPPARTPSSNQGSLHAILSAQQIHSSSCFRWAAPLHLPTPPPFHDRPPSSSIAPHSTQAGRHSSRRGLSGSYPAAKPPACLQEQCMCTTWRRRRQPPSPLEPVKPTLDPDCTTLPLPIHISQRAVSSKSKTACHEQASPL